LPLAPSVPAAPNSTNWGATIVPGGVYTSTFSLQGSYPYYLLPHPSWRGSVQVRQVPSDPGTVAPPIDPGVATTIVSSTSFLYTGPNPIQTGVAPGTIDGQRAAVLRGRVADRAGAPISLVNISVLDHPEYGQTLTRSDGMFDLASTAAGS